MKINVKLSIDVDGLQLACADGTLSEVWARALVSLDAAEIELMEKGGSLESQLGLVVLRSIRSSVQDTHRFVIAEEQERARSESPVVTSAAGSHRAKAKSTKRRVAH